MEEKYWKRWAKVGSLFALYFYLERLYQYIVYPMLIADGQRFVSLLTSFSFWGLLVMTTLIYLLPIIPLFHFGWNKEKKS